jgi:hypothetical protein
MKRKLFALTVLLGVTVLASWAPRAEATYPPCDEICDGTNYYARCTCPSDSDFPGLPAGCGGWYGRCYYL